MILDIFREKNTEIVFSVLPSWEMFFSMHVLSNPEHHASRKKWAESKEKSSPELIGRIRELDEITNTWTIIIDSDRWSEIRQMEIVEMLSYFRKMTIYLIIVKFSEEKKQSCEHTLDVSLKKNGKNVKMKDCGNGVKRFIRGFVWNRIRSHI